MAVVKIKTKSGFECEVDESVANDMEVLDLVVDIEKGNVLKYPALLAKLMGEETKRRLYNHVRVDGRVPCDAIDTEITEIFVALNGGKN